MREIPDFPKPGIQFYDVRLADPVFPDPFSATYIILTIPLARCTPSTTGDDHPLGLRSVPVLYRHDGRALQGTGG